MSMLENMSDGISVIAESQKDLSGQMNVIKDKVDNLEVKVDNLEVKVDVIDKRLTRVEGGVVEINERLIRVEEDVVDIKHKLPEKIDRDEFNKVEKRVLKLEKLVFAKLG